MPPPRSRYAHLPVSPLSMPTQFNFATSIVDFHANKLPTSPALQWTSQDHSTTHTLTYTHFSQRSQQIATFLSTTLGLQPGDLLILILPRLPEWWELATACLRMGVILCPCTTLLVDKDIEYRLNVSGAVAFAGDAVAVQKVLKVRGSCRALKHVIQINSIYEPSTSTKPPASPSSSLPEGVTDFHSAVNAIPPMTTFPVPTSLTPTSPALSFFTSGTTGPPKLVLHNATSYPLAHALTGTHWLRLRPPPFQSLYWNLSEQGWAKAAWSFFATWNCGACLFVHDDRLPFSARRTLEVLSKFEVTTLCAPPTVWRQLVLAENAKLIESRELRPRALRHAAGAGEPLNEGVIRRWAEMMGGMEICDGYGQTESTLVCANQEGMGVRYGSMGRPVPGVPLVVVDGEGEEVGAGAEKEGDIAIEVLDKGRETFMGLFVGYVDMKTGEVDRKVKEFKNGRRFYLTGDRAWRDKDGYFWFVGRSDDVINSSGYRIGPFEVESTLKLHPVVVESAVVASPDPQRDEVVKAFVVLTSEAANQTKGKGGEGGSGAKLVKELQDFCKQNAAPYKYPRKIEFVDAAFLPKTISGKIRRGELKKMEKEKYARENGKAKL